MKPAPGKPEPTGEHGDGLYFNSRCRCDQCRAVNAAYFRHRRAQLKDKPLPPQVAHGTDQAYNYYSCRCNECREARNARDRARYAAKKAKRP